MLDAVTIRRIRRHLARKGQRLIIPRKPGPWLTIHTRRGIVTGSYADGLALLANLAS